MRRRLVDDHLDVAHASILFARLEHNDLARDRLALFERPHLTCFDFFVTEPNDTRTFPILGRAVEEHHIGG